MADRIIYTRLDGGVSIVVPVREKRIGETREQYLAAIQAKAVPADATAVRVIDSANLPASRRWRNAWAEMGGGVGVVLSRARAIRLAELQKRRVEVFHLLREALDKADDDLDAPRLTALKQRRAALRSADLPAGVSAQATLEALEAYKGPPSLADPV